MEVVVSIFILGLMLVFYQSSFGTMRLAQMQKDKDIALRVVNQKMEALRAGGYGSLGASGSFSDTQLDSLQSASASTTITTYNASIKQVTVGVSWVESGSTQYLSETTLISQSGGL